MRLTPAIVVLQQDFPLPSPPSPGQMASYGFAGVIFAAFFFMVCALMGLGWKYLSGRDRSWQEAQEKRDQLHQAVIQGLTASHERVVERQAAATEKVGESTARANDAMVAALRDLQREVANAHKVFGEETVGMIFRRALREVKGE